MRFGRFDDERREYVITRPDTPLPSIDDLGDGDYLGLISNTAGGSSFYRAARPRRLRRHRYGEVRDDVFALGYAENPADAKFDPPGSQTFDKARVRPTIAGALEPGRAGRARRAVMQEEAT